MYKKSVALLVMLTICGQSFADYSPSSGYPANQGYQADSDYPAKEDRHHKHHHVDEKSREIDLRRLEALEKEDSEAYAHSKLAWGGVVAGTICTVVGTHNGNLRLILGGLAAVGISGCAGYVARQGENHRAKERREERDSIQKRLNLQHHHH